MSSAVDLPALVAMVVVAAVITAALAIAERRRGRRGAWTAAAVCAAVLVATGVMDLLREVPRETHIATPIAGALLPVLGATGMLLGTRRLRPWIRVALVFVTALVLAASGLLVGAALVPRLLAG